MIDVLIGLALAVPVVIVFRKLTRPEMVPPPTPDRERLVSVVGWAKERRDGWLDDWLEGREPWELVKFGNADLARHEAALAAYDARPLVRKPKVRKPKRVTVKAT